MNPSAPLGNFSGAQVALGEQNGGGARIENPPGLTHYNLNTDYQFSNLNGTNLTPGAAPYWPMN